MRFERLTNAEHELYKEAMELYKISFPPYEQRGDSAQVKVMDREDYIFNVIYDEDIFVGLMLCFETERFIYVEHFCILPTHRNKHYGQKALELLKSGGKAIILEIDPPIDEISIRRKGFYERLGLIANDYEYVHPGFYEGGEHPLVVMSYPLALKRKEFEDFVLYVNNSVVEKN